MTAERCPNCGLDLDNDCPDEDIGYCEECGSPTEEEYLEDGVCLLCINNRDFE